MVRVMFTEQPCLFSALPLMQEAWVVMHAVEHEPEVKRSFNTD